MNQIKSVAIHSLLATVILVSATEILRAQSKADSGVSITQLQLETMSVFSSPAVLLRAERSEIRPDGWSYGFAVGELLGGAENKQEFSAERLDLMLYAGLVFGLHLHLNG